jgi:hypothetical protein
MGAQISALLGVKRAPTVQSSEWVSGKPVKYLRGMFNKANGRNILEPVPPGENQYVTVFFSWADRLHNDEELMDLVVERIKAADGIISPEPVHHEIQCCLSLRVPRHRNATDYSIAWIAQDIARWNKSEMIHTGKNIDRSYMFRGSNFPRWKF